jgi:hypothetical protein
MDAMAATPNGCRPMRSIKPFWSRYSRPTPTLTLSNQQCGRLA